MPRKVAVVAHTHWDREWYQPFQQLRRRLVRTLDRLLDQLDHDAAFTRFLLDGQMAVVDDYLAVRPEAEERLQRLAADGRLSVGPWYVLMDEFCVSGETIVRNLQLGVRRAAAFGGAMPVGYLPDMFGHVAQMPQLLRMAGFAHAVVWRGVPGAVNRSAFWWRAPDGSTVRAEYLPVGYSVGAHLPETADDLLRRLRAEEEELGPFLGSPADAILLMNGSDHLPLQAQVPRLVTEVNAAQDNFELTLTSLPEYLATAPTDALPAWNGELRSGARANLLAGVLSNRTDIKATAAVAERRLERLAEPLAALWLDEDRWPAAAFDEAWLLMVRNSAHDSICACSADEVGQAVQYRFAEATSLADSVTSEALEEAAAMMAEPGPHFVNPSPRPRSGVVELTRSGNDVPLGAQVLEQVEQGTTTRTGSGADLARILGGLRKEGWLGADFGVRAELAVHDDRVELHIVEDAGAEVDRDLPSVIAEAWVQAGAHRKDPLSVRVTRAAAQRLLVRSPPVPGYGWAAWTPQALDVPSVIGKDNRLDNHLIHVAVNPADGTFAVNGLAGLGRLVDSGDDGDTYTYSPPEEDQVVERPEQVSIELVQSGPVCGRLRVTRVFAWPERIESGARVGRVEVPVVTDLEVRAGEAMVRVEVRFDHRVRDHRLRALFPLAHRADGSTAECAFATVERGLEAEGGPHELGLATFPSRRFVRAGGVTVTHEGLLEYEVVEGGWALALTVLRATGVLSKPSPAYRPNPAGPAFPLAHTQMIGPFSCRFAVALGPGDPFELADQAWTDLAAVLAPGGGPNGEKGSVLDVSGAEVSSLRRAGPALEARLYNPSDEGTLVRMPGRSGSLIDLLGAPIEPWADSFALGAWSIATARIDP